MLIWPFCATTSGRNLHLVLNPCEVRNIIKGVSKTSSAAEQPNSSFIVFLNDNMIKGKSSTQLLVSFLVAREVFRDR